MNLNGNNSALGIIETVGWVSLIEAADTMVKSANVSLVGYESVGSGMVSASIRGDVAAVKAALDAAEAAVKRLGPNQLVASVIIPKPAEGLDTVLPLDSLVKLREAKAAKSAAK